jgi:hypothetical protein
MMLGVIDNKAARDFSIKVNAVKNQLPLPSFLGNKLLTPGLSEHVNTLFRQSALSDMARSIRDLTPEHFDQLLLIAALSRYGQQKELFKSEARLLHHIIDFGDLPPRDQLVTTYGVEKEFFDCDDTRFLLNAFQYFDRTWLLTTDQTIDTGETCTTGHELISPILDQRNIHRVMLFAAILQAEQAQSSAYHKCALHVHVGIKNTFKDPAFRLELIRQMVINYAEIDDDLAFLNSYMTSPYVSHGKPKEDFMRAVLTGTEELLPEPHYQSSPIFQPHGRRFSRINLIPLSTLGTAEFRHHPGTVNPRDIAHWLYFVNDFMRVAVDMVTGHPAHLPTPAEKERLHGIATAFKRKSSIARQYGYHS